MSPGHTEAVMNLCSIYPTMYVFGTVKCPELKHFTTLLKSQLNFIVICDSLSNLKTLRTHTLWRIMADKGLSCHNVD